MSARSSTSGEVVVTTSYGPSRAARSRCGDAGLGVGVDAPRSARRRAASRGRPAAPAPAGPAAAGRRRGCGPARRSPSRGRPAGRARCPRPRPRAAPARPSRRRGRRVRRRSSRSGPANRSASWSATRIRARTCASAIASSADPPQVAAVGAYRPSRSTTAAASAGRAPASAVSRPGGDPTPDSGSCSAAGLGGRVRGAVVRQRLQASANRTTRRAATSPRLSVVAAQSTKNATGTHQHGDVPVHRHQLADGDGALRRPSGPPARSPRRGTASAAPPRAPASSWSPRRPGTPAPAAAASPRRNASATAPCRRGR